MRQLPKTYSINQTGAIATILAGATWGLAGVGAAMVIGRQTQAALIAFAVLTVIGWILLPLCIKLVKPMFLVGIIIWVIAFIGLAAMPGAPPWYMFMAPVYSFSFVVFYLIGIAGIYFNYKTYKEL